VARDPLYREGRFELAFKHYQVSNLREAQELLAPILEPSAEMRAHTSFLREFDAQQLGCQITVELGEPERALERLRELGRRDAALAHSPGVRLCHGFALERSGRPDEALKLYRKLDRNLGESAPAALQVAIARSLALLGRFEEAQQELDAIPSSERTAEIDRVIRVIRRQIRTRQ
jgi:predicted Zn-dependent protease